MTTRAPRSGLRAVSRKKKFSQSDIIINPLIDQACSVKIYRLLTKCEVRMAGYSPSSFFWVFMDGDGLERGQYPAILTEQTWSILTEFIIWLSGKVFLRDTAGSPERAR